MTAFDKILAAFKIHNQRGNWFYQTERNRLPMVDVSPGQAARFFHTVEVNLNQITTMVGYLPASAAKAHAVDAKPKAKPKAKASGQTGTVPASSDAMPTSPVKSEGHCQSPKPKWPRRESHQARVGARVLVRAQIDLPRTRRVNKEFDSIEGSAQGVTNVNMDTSLVQMASL